MSLSSLYIDDVDTRIQEALNALRRKNKINLQYHTLNEKVNRFESPFFVAKDTLIDVAPINGLYTAEELNQFMGGLLPELPPSERKDFSYSAASTLLSLGCLRYNQRLGFRMDNTKYVMAGANEPPMPDVANIIDITRRITIYPFPDWSMREAYRNGELKPAMPNWTFLLPGEIQNFRQRT